MHWHVSAEHPRANTGGLALKYSDERARAGLLGQRCQAEHGCLYRNSMVKMFDESRIPLSIP